MLSRLFRSTGSSRTPALLALEPAEPANAWADIEEPKQQDNAPVISSIRGEFEDIQQAVQKVQQQAADIRKETTRLKFGKLADSSHKVQKAQHVAEAAVAKARELLSQQFQGGAQRQDLSSAMRQRQIQQKLSDNLADAARSVFEAKREYDAAAKATAIEELPVLQQEENATVEAPRQSALIQQTDVTDAEVALEAEIVHEYSQRVSAVAQDIHGLRNAMVSLAEHAVRQGELVNSIEVNMSSVQEQTGKAAAQIDIASKRQAREIKQIFWLLVAAFSVATLILATAWARGYMA